LKQTRGQHGITGRQPHIRAQALFTGAVARLGSGLQAVSRPQQPAGGHRSLLALALVLIGVALMYAPTLNGYFHADDLVALVDVVNRPVTQHLWEALTFEDTDFYWRPLGHVYYEAIYQLFDLDPFWFRVGSLVLFVSTIVLLFKVALELGLSRWAAVASAAIFGFSCTRC
jgi:hypothetical protein